MNRELFDQYKLGIPEIDDEHWAIFTLMQTILSQVATTDYVGIQESLNQFLSDVQAHSDSEIELMRSMNFPFIDTHIVEHKLLLHSIERAIEHAAQSSHTNLTSAAEQLFMAHIVQYDALYAEYAAHITHAG